MSIDKPFEMNEATARVMAGNMIGKCVIALLKRGDSLSVEALRMELEKEPEGSINRPCVDVALSIIDHQP